MISIQFINKGSILCWGHIERGLFVSIYYQHNSPSIVFFELYMKCRLLLSFLYLLLLVKSHMNKDTRKFASKNKTLSSITPRSQLSNIQTSTRRKDSFSKRSLKSQSQISMNSRDKSISDSESSDASCLDKKFYRCACSKTSHGSCSHKYQNYIAEMREERLRKKEMIIEYFNNKESQSDLLVLSEDERDLDNIWAETPPRDSALHKIAEIS